MLYDGIKILEGSEIVNATVGSGTSFPNSPVTGQMFFRSDSSKMFIYNGTQWSEIPIASSAGSVPRVLSIVVTDSSYVATGASTLSTSGGYVKITGAGSGATTTTTDATNYVFPGGGSGGGGGGGGFTFGTTGNPTPWIGGASGGGGGTRLFGSGANGAAGTNATTVNQIAGGGGGGSANIGSNPALGGGGSFWNGGQWGSGGGVRIIWGEGRSFPNNAL
jgi:hypothetical protein